MAGLEKRLEAAESRLKEYQVRAALQKQIKEQKIAAKLKTEAERADKDAKAAKIADQDQKQKAELEMEAQKKKIE